MIRRIKDLVNLRNVKTDNTSAPYIALENIKSWDASFITSDATTEGTNNVFKKGDILFGKLRPYLAKGYIPEYDGICSTEFLVMEAKPDCCNKFLLYSFLSHGVIDYIKNQVAGVKMPRTSWNSFANISINIPSLADQHRIVNYLDSKTAAIDSQISVLEKKRDAYERLKQSVINRAVTRGLEENVPLKPSGVDWIGMIPEHWEVLRMKDVCVLSPTVESKNIEAEVSFLPMEGLRLGRLTTSVEICRNVYKKYTAFQEGDLLIAKVTPCFENGNISLAEGLRNGEGYGSSEIFVLRTKENCINKFLFYVALSKQFKDGACATMCGVGGLKRISPEFMKCRAIGFPPISEQQEIVDYLDEKSMEIDRAIENTTKQINAYKRLKRSLINEVVTGQRAI